MPFTASHVAAVLPLARTSLVTSALVIGSMSPDIPYYVPIPVTAEVTHSLTGVVSVDVLLGLAVFEVWHGLLVGPAFAAAPAGLRGRIRTHAVLGLRARLSSLRALLLICLSVSVGALTHVVWDAFTHAGRWGTNHIPWLVEEHGPLAGYRWAQYGSGLFGALVVALWLARWWRSTALETCAPGLRPAVAAGAWLTISVAGAAGAAVASVGPLTSPEGPDLRSAAFLGATRGIAVAAVAVLLLAASWHVVGESQPADKGDVASG